MTHLFTYIFLLSLPSSSFFYRYVGSPYQTSLSEAGQEKYLYCMNSKTGLQSNNNNDTNSNSNNNNNNSYNSNGKNLSDSNCYNWREEDRWPIDIGRKYFRVSRIIDIFMLICLLPIFYLICSSIKNED